MKNLTRHVITALYSTEWRNDMTIYAKELQRRLDSGEPIEKIRKWYLYLKEPWESYFRDLEPVEQEFMKHMCSDFRAWLQRQENPDSVTSHKQ